MSECTCEVFKGYKTGKHHIRQCPLCKAAPSLRDALRSALIILEEIDGGEHGHLFEVTPELVEARAALDMVNK